MTRGPTPKPIPADFAETFPRTSNDELSLRYGVHVRTLIRWARDTGLTKSPDYIAKIRAAPHLKTVEQDGMKRCIACNELKPLSDFYDTSSKRRKQPRCKPCHSVSTNAWRQANPEAVKRITRRSQLKGHYGINETQWQAIHSAQGGKCAICGRTDDGSTASRRLHTDHCHEAKIVRGLLCTSCNAGLGRFQHDQDLLLAAIRYLVSPPAATVLSALAVGG